MGKQGRTAKKIITLQTAMTKNNETSVIFFREKIGVTPSVAAPGDTNPSDATAHNWVMEMKILSFL